MLNGETRLLVLETISKLESKVAARSELDLLWSDTKGVIMHEMNKLPNLPQLSTKEGKNKKNSKLLVGLIQQKCGLRLKG